MTVTWGDVSVVGVKRLPPDPDLVRTLGHNYSLESALADIVDNSIDAGADAALIRFVRDGNKLVSLLVIDNGRGMDGEKLDLAMTIGKRRSYGAADLGHFGIGLKAASLGQASSLTVITKTQKATLGRRWTIERAKGGFECEIVSEAYAKDFFNRNWSIPIAHSGTIIRWDRVNAFPGSTHQHVVDGFLEDAIVKIRQYLGLIFHRILHAGKIKICLDVEDIGSSLQTVPYEVAPIDPFGYSRSGRLQYPKTIQGRLNGHPLSLHCCIWPGRSQLVGFKLPGGTLDKFQGFYFYRRNRLLQAGGWCGVALPRRELQLARVAVEIDGFGPELFALNPEKTKVETGAEFCQAVEAACALDGTSFAGYLEHAIQTFKTSRIHDRSRARVIPPGKGLTPSIKKTIRNEVGFLPGEEPLDIRWETVTGDTFFELDRDNRVIRLNKKYRRALAGGIGGSLNDSPLIKTLLYLLVENLFHGAYLKSKSKDNIELLQAILTSAAEAEISETL